VELSGVPENRPAIQGGETGPGPDDAWLLDLALLLGRGRMSVTAVAAAQRLAVRFPTPARLAAASPEEMRSEAGISNAQAALIGSGMSLGRLACAAPIRAGQRFSSSRDLFHRYRAQFLSSVREHFFSLHLNSKNQLLREVLISVGSLNSSVVHPREVYAPAVKDSAAAVVFMHNHPSGDPAPSREDRECTQRLCHAGRILGIRVLDHVILGHDDYFSFADSGLLSEPGAN
jgi:DNA repair protein RadC